MKYKNYIILVMLMFVSLITYAQNNYEISGVVVDPKGDPLIGATVKIPGESTGTVTDLNGNFKLNVKKNAKMLIVSYIGYKTITKPINGKNLRIILKENLQEMDQVVVIGYGSIKKSNVTAAISKVSSEQLEDRPVSNVASALQGELAGVEVRTTTGKPGSGIDINVRGATTINENGNSAPLYVVDGVPMDETFDLVDLNTDDIKSIDVLKDASSSAIYGSRGSNGVVLITTKKGLNNGQSTLTFSANFGLQQAERKVDVMDGDQWTSWNSKITAERYATTYGKKGATVDDDYAMRIALRGGQSKTYVSDYRWTLPGHPGVTYIDWQDALFRLAPIQNYQIASTGGNSKSNYRISIGFTSQDGIVVFSNYKKVNINASTETKFKDFITFGASVSASVGWQEGADVDGKDNIGMGTVSMSPVVNSNAGLYSGVEPYSTYIWAGGSVSPYARLKSTTDKTENIRINTSAFVRTNLFKGFTAELLGAWNFNNKEYRTYRPGSITSQWDDGPEGFYSDGTMSGSRTHSFMLQALATYNHSFGNHNINAVAGWSIESISNSTNYKMAATQFPNDALQGFNLNDELLESASYVINSPSRMVSVFGRIQYNYGDRYLANVSLRRDGSSRFGTNQRWGTFPAVSGAWRIANEKFWPQRFFITDLKLRASYGVNGSNSVSSNAALGTLSSSNYSYNGVLVNGYTPSSSDNPELTWQKTDSWDVALDAGLFKNRISFSVDFYVKKIRDMLYQISLPSIMGYSSAYSNIGSIRNTGLEIEIKSLNLTGKFKWTTNLNLAFAKNKVIDLGNNSAIYTGFAKSTQILEVGKEVGEYYLYDAIGVFQTQADLDAYPHQSTDKVGDIRYRDVDFNNVIDSNDRTYYGSPNPKCTYGIINTFKWGNWDASLTITGQGGGKIYSALGRAIDRQGQGYSSNVMTHFLDMWYSESNPGTGSVPSVYGSAEQYDNRWLYSSDFIKIKNLTLGYNFPLKKTALLSSIRLYGSIENLIQIDNYKGGFSPEANNNSSFGNTSYYDYGSYPMARVFSLGLKVGF